MATLHDLYNSSAVEAQPGEPAGERVLVEPDNFAQEEATLKLRQQSWAKGMGWFTQKTINLDLAQAEKLAEELKQAVISTKLARSQSRRPNAKARPAQTISPASKIVEFPGERRISQEKRETETEPGKILEFRPRS